MFSRKMKILMIAVGCAAALSACTKSNIVQPESSFEPDFNMYNNIELDEEQLQADVEDVWLDESEFPMGAAFAFELHEDEAYVDMSVVVKDGTSPEDAAWYADQVVKGFNDSGCHAGLFLWNSRGRQLWGIFPGQRASSEDL